MAFGWNYGTLGATSQGVLTPANVPSVQLWLETDSNITTGFDTASMSGKEVSGSSGTNMLVSAGDLSSFIQSGVGQRIQLNGAALYDITTISTIAGISTLTTLETLSTNYTAASVGLERVSAWGDKSPNAYSATQSTGAQKYIVFRNASNSKPSFFANAVSINMIISSAIASITNSSNTVYIVAKSQSANQNNALFGLISTSTSNGIVLKYGTHGTTGRAQYQAGAFGNVVNTADITQTDFGIMRGRRSGTTIAVSYNNSVEVTASTGANETSNSWTVGEPNTFDTNMGEIQAIIVCNASLTQGGSDDTIINNYLKAKYGTP